MVHSLQCKCGKLKGQLSDPEKGVRVVCYCKDCQAFAHFLGKADEILDPVGGTDIVATQPGKVSFTEGQEHVACMSLSPKGTLRWYAACCNTPIGNTARTPKMAHLGLVHNCLAPDTAAMDKAFGPVRMHTATKSANGPAPSSGLRATVPLIGGFLLRMLGARLGGGYRRTPFFKSDLHTPAVTPKVISKEERDRLRVLTG